MAFISFAALKQFQEVKDVSFEIYGEYASIEGNLEQGL